MVKIKVKSKNMNRRTRLTIFLSLSVLFLLVAPLAVFYSLGWRFDWKTKKITQPGIFYFKVWPKNVEIYLNGNLEEKTDFFFSSTLVENLLPGNYNIEIKKEGFHSWKKTLKIEKRQATEVKNIVLIPENPSFIVITKEIEDLFFSPDNEKIILKNKSNLDLEKQSWSLKLFELKKNVKSHLIDEKDISEKKVHLIDLKFSPDSKRVLLKVETEEQLMYYLLEIDTTPAVLTYLFHSVENPQSQNDLDDFLDPNNIKEIHFDPENSQKLFILLVPTEETGEGGGELYEVYLTDQKISPTPLKNIIACSVSNSDIYYLDSSGFLFKTDNSFKQQERLNMIPFPLTEKAEYKITVSNYNISLEENDILYIFDRNKKSFQKLLEPAKNFRLSPDSRKMLYFNDHEIWVLFLEYQHEQPQKESGEKLFITRFSEKIDEVFWYTNHYLIFNTGDKIKVAEIDDRDRINIVELVEFKESKLFWNLSDKKLYILIGETLFSSEKIAP